nr:hypothetical protein TDPV-227 [Oriental turtle dovepox virus]
MPAPSSISVSIVLFDIDNSAARASGVLCLLSSTLTSASYSKSILTSSAPSSMTIAAQCNGVWSFMYLALGSAPRSNNVFVASSPFSCTV